MSYRPGHRLRFVGRTYPEYCHYCRTPASQTRNGVRVCEEHAKVISWSNVAVLVVGVVGVAGALGYAAAAYLRGDPGDIALGAMLGAGALWLAYMAWRETNP